jgi:hypothetical protein
MTQPPLDGEIKIINGPAPVVGETAPSRTVTPDHPAGHGTPEEHFKWPFSVKKPVTELTKEIAKLKSQIGTIVGSLAQLGITGAELHEVTVGLAVSIEGDIGIASAGAEASIELAFTILRTDPAAPMR